METNQTTSIPKQLEDRPPAALLDAFPSLREARCPVQVMAERLAPFLHVIVDRFHPEKIILFGSQVYGIPGPDSDVDILVVRRGIQSENESNAEILNAFWDVPGDRPAFTVLTKTPERIAERLAAGSPFYREIIARGLEVYAA